MADELEHLYERIEVRCRAVTEAAPDWPCAKGCDACCRSLAEPPRATRAEWQRLLGALARLEPEVQARVRRQVGEMARLASGNPPPKSHVCPLLDLGTHSCRVYAGRLSACRTYGFYVSREKGAWCDRVRTLAEVRPVILGNEDALEAELARLGPAVGIAQAFGIGPGQEGEGPEDRTSR